MKPAQPKQPAHSPLVQASSITRALNIVGDRWSLLIVYCVFLGMHRFADIQETTGMSRSLLAGRLRRLEAQGLLRRQPYQRRPPRYEYRLTGMGRDLYDVALAIIHWDKSWHYEPRCITHHIVHTGCGRSFTPRQQCGHCGETYSARDVHWRQGPGVGMDPHPGPSASRRSSLSRETLSGRHAIMVRSLELLGDRWTSLVIAAAFYRVRYFNDFQTGLGVASNILSDRLERLTELGILHRSGGRSRPEYRLTEQGIDLFPIIVCLMRWGDRWLDEGKGPPLLLFHRSCESPLEPVMVCDQCGERLGYQDFRLPEGLLSRSG